jgi:hypothetical protein
VLTINVLNQGGTKMTLEIRIERGGHCAFAGCKRKGYAVLTDIVQLNSVGFYRECKKHLMETIDTRDFSDNAKAQLAKIVEVSHD